MSESVDVQVAQGLLAAMVTVARRVCDEAEASGGGAQASTLAELIPHLERLRPLGIWDDEEGLLDRMRRLSGTDS